MTSRGLKSVKALGRSLFDEALSLAVPVMGWIIHTDSDDADQILFQRCDRNGSEYNYSISRYELNAHLLNAADKAGVHTEFDHQLSETSDVADSSSCVPHFLHVGKKPRRVQCMRTCPIRHLRTYESTSATPAGLSARAGG